MNTYRVKLKCGKTVCSQRVFLMENPKAVRRHYDIFNKEHPCSFPIEVLKIRKIDGKNIKKSK